VTLEAILSGDTSDDDLIARARTGDADAFGELFARHRPAAMSAARAITGSKSDAEDVVSEAFLRLMRVLQAGGGPDVTFRAYLLRTVRNVHIDGVRRDRDVSSDDLDEVLDLRASTATSDRLEGRLAVAAYASLPERWQTVLWLTEVEGRAPAEAAPLLGLAPNAAAALAYRAREGLRQAYLQQHIGTSVPSGCAAFVDDYGAYVRGGLAPRVQRAVESHLASCSTCPALIRELDEAGLTLRGA
jgi:RNA polymerase sigma factor (sigma-70 family)